MQSRPDEQQQDGKERDHVTRIERLDVPQGEQEGHDERHEGPGQDLPASRPVEFSPAGDREHEDEDSRRGGRGKVLPRKGSRVSGVQFVVGGTEGVAEAENETRVGHRPGRPGRRSAQRLPRRGRGRQTSRLVDLHALPPPGRRQGDDGQEAHRPTPPRGDGHAPGDRDPEGQPPHPEQTLEVAEHRPHAEQHQSQEPAHRGSRPRLQEHEGRREAEEHEVGVASHLLAVVDVHGVDREEQRGQEGRSRAGQTADHLEEQRDGKRAQEGTRKPQPGLVLGDPGHQGGHDHRERGLDVVQELSPERGARHGPLPEGHQLVDPEARLPEVDHADQEREKGHQPEAERDAVLRKQSRPGASSFVVALRLAHRPSSP